MKDIQRIPYIITKAGYHKQKVSGLSSARAKKIWIWSQ